jgi:hypothetical protein
MPKCQNCGEWYSYGEVSHVCNFNSVAEYQKFKESLKDENLKASHSTMERLLLCERQLNKYLDIEKHPNWEVSDRLSMVNAETYRLLVGLPSTDDVARKVAKALIEDLEHQVIYNEVSQRQERDTGNRTSLGEVLEMSKELRDSGEK